MAGRETGETGVGAVVAVSLEAVRAAAARHFLAVLGGFQYDDEPGLPAGTRTVLLLGPMEPGYWAHVQAQPEWGGPDPVDRWSRRVIGRMACDFGSKALFPFGGPPYNPFYDWALRTGRAWASPVRLLVQAEQGLLVSYRGALALKQCVEVPEVTAAPCIGCARPCIDACPVAALGAGGYDVPACKQFLAQPDGADCLNLGCAVRRACPVSVGYARLPEQSAYHMGKFNK
jgi:epoxyqueuosine reductase